MLGRVIDPILEGSFTVAEKTLGDNFCNSLSYKRSRFPALYGSGNKVFNFTMAKKNCGDTDENQFNQRLIYSTTGGITYASVSAPAIVPIVELESAGVFALYCANRLQNSRVYSIGTTLYSYHFYDGEVCKGVSGEICAVYEKTAADKKTIQFKKFLISTGLTFNLDMKGQEMESEEHNICTDGSNQYLHYGLNEVVDS